MASEKNILSKSTFIRGVQCLKSLYLNKHRPFLRDKLSPEQLAKFSRGHSVGQLAQQLFPGGINCAPSHPAQSAKSIDKTAELIKSGASVIYEAAFSYNQLIIFLDILVRTETGWHAYEVKSSLSVSETYIQDAALQYNVIGGSGLHLESFSIIYLNADYSLKSALEIGQYFLKKEVTQEVVKKQDWIENQIVASKETLELKKSPAIPAGSRCYQPYPCDFRGHCWKNLNYPVFEIPGLSLHRKLEFVDRGIVTLADIPIPELTETEKRVIDAHKSGIEFFDKEKVRSISGRDSHPDFYLKFMLISMAMPVFEGMKPYEPLIFGFTILRSTGETTSYITPPGSYPGNYLPEILQKIKAEGHSGFYFGEDIVEQALEKGLPDIVDSDFLTNISGIFSGVHYYNPAQTSIDNVNLIVESIGLIHERTSVISDVMIGVNYLKADPEIQLHSFETIKKSAAKSAESLKLIVEHLKQKIRN